MSDRPEPAAEALLERIRSWLYESELARSRMLWRLESDLRLEPPWPYADAWFDPAGAALLDLRGHPELGELDPPWFYAEGSDPAALELLCGVRLPPSCEVLLNCALQPVLEKLGTLTGAGVLEVWSCAPGELGEAALPYEPTRLDSRHRALVVDDLWRPDDFGDEQDEDAGGVRWAIIREQKLVSRLLCQRVSRNVVEIADLHTRPTSRRRGYGAALVQHVVRRMHERGLTVTYSVHPSNEPSRQLAAGVGFRPLLSWERVRLERL